MAQSEGAPKMEKDDVEKEEDVNLMTGDWKFNVTLLNIAGQITPEELKMMKNLTKGSNGLGKRVLEKIKDVFDLFNIMQDRTFLDPNNLLHLQGLLWAIGRKDLCIYLADFARKDRKKPLHFFPTKEQPENGYKFLKIHIDGANTSKQDVKNLRHLVAELLLTPVEYIYFVGYEPSSSIIVTFMVPTDNTQQLKALSEEDRGLLKSMHVDYIFIGEEEVSIIGESYKPPVTLSNINEITKFMREKKRLERELQESLVLSSQRYRDLKRQNKHTMDLEIVVHQQAYALSYCLFEMQPKQLPVDSMDHGTVLSYFRHTLQKFFEEFPHKQDEVYALLEANELITRKHERHKWRAFSTAQQLAHASVQTTMGIGYGTVAYDNVRKAASNAGRGTIPWQNYNIHQTVLQMPNILMQQPPTSQNPYQVSPTQTPHSFSIIRPSFF